MALWVQKYGGTSVADPERIRSVARRCLRARAEGHDLVVTTTMLSGTGSVPVIHTVSFLTGIGVEQDIEKIINYLKDR